MDTTWAIIFDSWTTIKKSSEDISGETFYTYYFWSYLLLHYGVNHNHVIPLETKINQLLLMVRLWNGFLVTVCLLGTLNGFKWAVNRREFWAFLCVASVIAGYHVHLRNTCYHLLWFALITLILKIILLSRLPSTLLWMLWMNVAWKASGEHLAGNGSHSLSWEQLLLI